MSKPKVSPQVAAALHRALAVVLDAINAPDTEKPKLRKRVPGPQRVAELTQAEAFVRAALGRELRAARERAGLTQEQVAKEVGESYSMISAAELGRSMSVDETYVVAVLKACGLPPDWHLRER
jgi:ribosome-binding protein aMBF1 (putative translation factor)